MKLIGMPKGITRKQLAAVEKVVRAFQPEAEEIMAAIPENSITQDDYHWYMSIIAMIGNNAVMKLCWINALLRAGANPKGINAAVQVMS